MIGLSMTVTMSSSMTSMMSSVMSATKPRLGPWWCPPPKPSPSPWPCPWPWWWWCPWRIPPIPPIPTECVPQNPGSTPSHNFTIKMANELIKWKMVPWYNNKKFSQSNLNQKLQRAALIENKVKITEKFIVFVCNIFTLFINSYWNVCNLN